MGRALRAWDSDARVLVVGSGGLSHQLDGERAGFIHRDFDLAFLESLVHEPRWATQFDTHQLVEQAGTQGVELLMWLAARAALGERCHAGAPELPHPDLQHRGRAAGDGARRLNL